MSPDLALHAFHGVMEHEATVGQTFYIDLVLDIDLTQASRSDKIADTVGYDQVVDVASRTFCAQRYRLVEAAAGAIADAVLTTFPAVTSVRVTVHKPHAPVAATFSDVGVTIVRTRQAKSAMPEALIALGGNVGDVRDTFDDALAMLCDGAEVTPDRPLVRSIRPRPGASKDQPPFINCCAAIETASERRMTC